METINPDIFLCLGSNLGDRIKMLMSASELIEQKVGKILKRSSIYETESWGMENAEPFLNQVIQVTSGLLPHEVLSVLQGIEKTLGRTHKQVGSRQLASYDSRSIDLDILFYGKEIIETPGLIIPHPHIAERKFVLVPLAEIAREFVHPKLGKSIDQLLLECRDKGEIRVLG